MIAIDKAREDRQLLLEALRTQSSGLSWCQQHTRWADRLVRTIYRDAVGDDPYPFALVATGGFGRQELCPFSDIDISLVARGEVPDEIVKKLFRGLHATFDEGLGLHVGYSFRNAADAPGLDGKSRTALLDARLLVGDAGSLEELNEAMWASFPTPDFLIQKMEEREDARHRTHDTPLTTEPHLKEGAGGLRAFHTSNWVRAALGARMQRPPTAFNEILRIRNLLHLLSEKQLEVLSKARREEISGLLGINPYDLAAHLASCMTSLDEEERTAFGEIRESRFWLAPGVLAWKGEVRFEESATAGSAALGVAAGVKLGLEVTDIAARLKPEASATQAVTALSSGEQTLRAMDRCGVLDALLPELSRCRYIMPRDGSHQFTVFEHTIRAIRYLDQLQPGSVLGDIKASLRELAPLYLAVLLHDVGKIDESRPHSETGAEMAQQVAERWGLYPQTTQMIVWLVREHLSMARTIRMRDVMNAETSNEFARFVETEERLALLTLLTYADVRAVSSETWTPVQQTFAEELYRRTSTMLTAELSTTPDHTTVRRRIKRTLERNQIDPTALEKFVESLPAHYLFSTQPDDVLWHYSLVQQAERDGCGIELKDYRNASVTDILIACSDRPGLLSDLLGVIYALDLSLVTIRAATTRVGEPMILDLFTVSFSGRPVPPGTAVVLERELREVIAGKPVDGILTAHQKDPLREQEIFQWSARPGTPTIIDIQAPRGRGMAYRMSKLIARQGWNILAARLSQWAGQGAASFYVEKPGGGVVSTEEVERAFTRQKV